MNGENKSEFGRRDFLISGTASIALGLFGSANAASKKKGTSANQQKNMATTADHILLSQKGGNDRTALEHYDIAMFPEDDDLRKECIRLARTNLGNRADAYLLGEDAFPHVTLTLYQCEESQLADMWKSISAMQSKALELEFTHIYIDPDMHHQGLLWVGLALRPQKDLVQLQNSVYEHLKGMGIVGRTKPETYFPHLTWARCRDTVPFALKELPSIELYQKTHRFKITIGKSNENGVYRERIFG